MVPLRRLRRLALVTVAQAGGRGGRATQTCRSRPTPGLVESRQILLQRLAIRDSVKLRASAIRRFGNSTVCQT